jgi:hypothetical protein
MVEVGYTDELGEWYEGLDQGEADAVFRSVRRLEQMGVTLDYPYSSAIKGARHALRELRVQAKGKPLRVFYAFDPQRDAVLLIGGDKTGDGRFYERMVPRADDILTSTWRSRLPACTRARRRRRTKSWLSASSVISQRRSWARSG